MTDETSLVERQTTIFEDLERAAHIPAGSIDMCGLSLTDPDMPYEDWETLGRMFGNVRRWANWAIGDWFIFGEAIYGHESAQATESTRSERFDVLNRVTGLAPATLANYASLCGRIPRNIRRVELDFSVHEPVAALERSEQIFWLQEAVDKSYSREELREAIKESKKVTAGDGEGDDGESDPEAAEKPRSIAQRVEDAARLVYNSGQTTSEGGALVPADAWHELAEALGED